MPSKLYTFMAAGRPILGLADPDSEVATLLREKECGLAVPPDGAAAVAEAVRTLRSRRRDGGFSAGTPASTSSVNSPRTRSSRSYDKLLRSMVS